VAVGYYYDIAWFEDVIITSADLRTSGGDSGSPVWLWKRAE
jgi:V8-like Glu-specific endopeptidase